MTLEKIRAEREARKAALAVAREEQRLLDETRLNELEVEYGDGYVVGVEIQRFAPGRVTMAVCRSAKEPELKRFRDRTRPQGSDAAVAAAEVAELAVLYPARDSEEWAQLKASVPGLATRIGVAAVQLASGLECEEGNV